MRKRIVHVLTVAALVIGMIVLCFHFVNASDSSNEAAASSSATATSQSTQATSKTATTQKLSNTTNDATNQALQSAWKNVLANVSGLDVDIAVYSPKTNKTYTYTVKQSDSDTFDTASIVKASVLTAVLHKAKKNGTTLTTTEKSELQTMIENSDNDACTDLLNNDLGGYDGNDATYSALNMNNTKANLESWGLTTTTAADQVKLLNTIFYGANNYLTKSERSYAMQLMNTTESDQQWGISAGSTNYQLKNGWLSDDSGKWIVNSIGHVGAINADGYTIAVLTYGSSSQAAGEQVIENLAEATKNVLG
ncbi:hypothetical protein IV38_GL001581 [Lactobacillus selangorensis]|uniref:Penicillin-binding protein n=1 Tax=Lactobacillus selangorensis TaxID=81857 RepID=A0A0R2FRD1_9LACO|nr:serine hydrolase [Lactobacillus selangorensis]KRN28130.1 hypothetical protein IV38_GL001581 [Lactobacillus selangorensis]KRN30993.1 hypothetical protein IV40_GL001634 [Lactobacillus selangorensis]